MCCVLNTGMFGVPLDICAQTMYHAIKAVVDKVSNLSLREVHLVNIKPETTQFIQSVFLQLSSDDDDGSVVFENPLGKPSPAVAESQGPSPGRDESVPGVGVEDEGRDKVRDLQPEDLQTSALETLPDGRNAPDEEVVVDHSDLLVAEQDPKTYHSPQDEKILDQEQTEGQESVVEKCQHSSTVVPDTEECFDDPGTQEQKSLESSRALVEQDDKKLADMVQVTDKVWNAEDGDDQSFDIEISDHEQKTLESSQTLVEQDDKKLADMVRVTDKVWNAEGRDDQTFDDHERKTFESSQTLVDQKERSADEMLHAEVVSNTTAKDSHGLNKSPGEKDSETGEVAGYEEDHRLSSKPEPQLEVFMQDLSLEEYREFAPASAHHEPSQVVPSDLPEDLSQRQMNSGPWSLVPSWQDCSHDDRESFYSVPDDVAQKDDRQKLDI